MNFSAVRSCNRAKETGIRKVLAATESNIVLILTKQFLKWVLISNAIAISITYLFMSNWLEDFAYKTDISLNDFLIAALVAFVAAFLTVGFQALKAARVNPATSLRHE